MTEKLSPGELKTLFLFEALTDEQLRWLAEHGRVEQHPAGTTVFGEGQPAASFYVLLSGTLSLSRRVQQDEVETARTDQRGVYMGATQSYVREEPGVKKVFVASGIRMDLARRSPEYMQELAAHHVGGHLKVAPEHVDPGVLDLMKKPANDDFLEFDKEFKKASKKAGKKQYLVPYFIASHPGSDLDAMIELALFLKRNHYQPDQVQDFIPSPFDLAACMYHTGIDPLTNKPVYIAKHLRDRKLQRALLQFFKPENYFEVRRALEQAGRQDLIGSGCDCLIPDRPPKAALDKRRKAANKQISEQREGDHIRSKAGVGYRPHRKSSQKRSKK